MSRLLFGFWKVPEHVRFYHADLIESVCRHYGLPVETTNKDDAPLYLGPVTLEVPHVDRLEPAGSMAVDVATQESRSRRPRLLDRVMRRLGLITRSDLDELRRELLISVQDLRSRAQLFAERLGKNVEEYNLRAHRAADALNQIWSEADEIVMVCRKREGTHAG